MKNQRKSNSKSLLLLIVLVLAVSCSMVGCGPNSHVDEPEITVEYLQGEYSEQLIRDGAEVVFGLIDEPVTLSGTPEEGTSEGGITQIQFTINAKEYVADDNAEGGFYIADRNKSYIVYAGDDTRVAFDFAGTGTLDIVSVSELMNQNISDKYFDIYLFDDQVLLILEHII